MKILACIDSSRYAVSVCDHAAWAATQMSVPVELLHVLERHATDPKIAADRSGRLGVDSRGALLKELIALDEQRNRLEQQAGRHLLDEAAAEVREGGISDIKQRLVHGELVDHLPEHEVDAAVIIIGQRGESEDHAELHLGRNVERVIRASHKPVLVVAQQFRPVTRLLVAYDGGFGAEKAITFLLNEPLLTGAECHLLTVGNGSDNEQTRLAHAATRLRDAGYIVTESIRPGEPDHVIPEVVEASGVDLLVVGAYGHSRVRPLIIGSTTTTLLRTCPTSMLIIR